MYGRFGYSGLKEAGFCSRRTLWDFNRLRLGSYWKEAYLWGDRQSGAHLFSRDATAPDGLIVTRDTSVFKTYRYLIDSLESSMSLASGTRTRPPQSGFVQTGFWEVSVRCGRLWLMLCQGSLLTSLITIDEEPVLTLHWRRLATRESPRTAAGPIHSCAGHRCVGP